MIDGEVECFAVRCAGAEAHHGRCDEKKKQIFVCFETKKWKKNRYTLPVPAAASVPSSVTSMNA